MIINANALHIPLADKSVHTIVTSPPYYGLRDYQVSGQLGLEPTPDEYIANLVEVFRECKRILRDDGTLWVNIGDSYTSDGFNRNSVKLGSGIQADQRAKNPDYEKQTAARGSRYYLNCGLKAKDLIGIPWMLAFALRADGWYLRQDIIWAKPNPMPESVKDRCTKSHEYIFLLSKSAKYYYDNEAVKEPLTDSSIKRGKYGWHGNTGDALEKGATPSGGGFNRLKQSGENLEVLYNQNGGRNKRDVWHVATKPYKGAHYATFPPDLITPCILAGAPEGGIVFDPFVGSGTTVATAIQLGRRGVGIDLSMKYLIENAKERIESVKLPLLEFVK